MAKKIPDRSAATFELIADRLLDSPAGGDGALDKGIHVRSVKMQGETGEPLWDRDPHVHRAFVADHYDPFGTS